MIDINAPTSGLSENGAPVENSRSVSDIQTIVLPNGNIVSIPLGGYADPLGYGFRDPYIGANVPEEKVPLIVDDNLILRIMTNPLAGSPAQSTRVFDLSASTETSITLNYDVIPENYQSVLVFRDGILANPDAGTPEYTVDQFNMETTVTLFESSTRYKTIHVHALGVGSNLPIINQFFLSGTGNATYELGTTISLAQLGVTVNGVRAFNYTLGSDNKSITFSSTPPVGAEILINVYQTNATTEPCLINVEYLTYSSSNTYTLNYNDTATLPEYAGTFVFVNGEVLMPPLSYYGVFSSSDSSIVMDYTPNGSETFILYYINAIGRNFLYTGSIPVIDSLTQTGASSPNFAFLNNTLVSLSGAFVSPLVSLTILVENDYTLSGTTLHITKTTTSADNIRVINFKNAAALDLMTYTYEANNSGQYYVVNAPVSSQFALVSNNGLMMRPDIDYSFIVSNGVSYLNAPGVSSGYIVIRIFNGAPYRPYIEWLASTTTPSPIRMEPVVWTDLTTEEQGQTYETVTYSGSFVNNQSFLYLGNNVITEDSVYTVTLNDAPYTDVIPIFTSMPQKYQSASNVADLAFLGSTLISQNQYFLGNVSITIQNVPVDIVSNINGWACLVPYYPEAENPYYKATLNQAGVPQPWYIYTNNTWLNTKFSFVNEGTLSTALELSTQSINVSLYQSTIATQLQTPNPFFVPTDLQVGVVWINGERIEYLNVSYADGVATLSGLKRATKGTSINENRTVVSSTPEQTVFVLDGSVGVVEVAKTNTANGRSILVPASNYTVVFDTEANTTTVTLDTATSDYYTVSLTNGLSHPVGSIVYNGNQTFTVDVPLGIEAGDIYTSPVDYLIQGL